jgi:hypothetical protein
MRRSRFSPKEDTDFREELSPEDEAVAKEKARIDKLKAKVDALVKRIPVNTDFEIKSIPKREKKVSKYSYPEILVPLPEQNNYPKDIDNEIFRKPNKDDVKIRIDGEYLKPDHIEYYHSLLNKPREKKDGGLIERYLESNDKQLNDHQLKSYLITINYDPNTSYISAWSGVNNKVDKICKALYRSDLPIHLVTSTIEHTHQIKSNRKESKVHQCQTYDDLVALYEESKFPPLKNINSVHYTMNLLNIITELIYTGTLCTRDELLLIRLKDLQKEISPLVDRGQSYNFPCSKCNTDTSLKGFRKGDILYESNIYLWLANEQENKKRTTLGYPHIHIALMVSSSNNYINIIKKIDDIVRSVSELVDVDVKPQKFKNKPSGSFIYTIKNMACQIVIESLVQFDKQREAYRPLITNYICTNNSSIRTILNNMLRHISTYDGKDYWSSNANGNNKDVALTIFNIASKEDNNLKTLEYPFNFQSMDPEINNGEYLYVNLIQEDMKQKKLAICKGRIFQKIPNSKTSWTYEYDVEEYIRSTQSDLKISTKFASRIIEIMKTDLINNLRGNTITTVNFPRIEINFRMIEYGDFYLDLITRCIFKTQSQYQTYRFCPTIRLSNLEDQIKDLIDNSLWIKQLESSAIFNVDNIGSIYRCLITRVNEKDSCILVVGPPNTGKTIAISFAKYAFPSFLLGVIQNPTEHHIADQVVDRLLIIGQEGNTLTRKIDTIDRGLLLLLAEGGDIIANKKHGDITQFISSQVGLILTANIEKEDEKVYASEALVKRFDIILTELNTEKDFVAQTYEEAAARREYPLIALFAAMCNFTKVHNFENLQNLPIFDNLEEEHVKIISLAGVIERDEQEIYLEGESITKYSKDCTNSKLLKKPAENRFNHTKLPERKYSDKERLVRLIQEIIIKLKSGYNFDETFGRAMITEKVNKQITEIKISEQPRTDISVVKEKLANLKLNNPV